MAPHLIFLPATAMVFLTIIVTFRMFFERKRQAISEGIRFRDIPSSSQMAAHFKDTRAADNYRNLFETPVMFYLALVVVFVTGQVSVWTLGLAWAYVALRYLHSYIHCTYNRIRDRFYAFLISNVVLWTLWSIVLISLLRG